MKIIFKGALDNFTGFGQQFCHLILFCIRLGHDVRVVPLSISELFTSVVPKEIKDRIVSGDQGPGVRWEMLHLAAKPNPEPGAIYSTVWESDQLFTGAVEGLNRARCVVVPSDWCADACRNSGVTVPVYVVPHGIDKNVFHYQPPIPDATCVFGAAGRLHHGPVRKGLRDVITAFRKAFPREQDVKLRLKCFPDCSLDLPHDNRIIKTTAFYSDSEVAEWLGTLTCFVSSCRSEGFGMWQLQALAVGRPVISPFHGGCNMYLTESNSYSVRFGYATAGEYCSSEGKWCEPDMDSLIEQMQRVYSNRREAAAKGICGSIETAQLTTEASCLAALRIMEAVA